MKSFEEMGGRQILIDLMVAFYDRVYDHPWLGLYFQDTPREIIESQQVDFLQSSLGGEKVYCGGLPVPAHSHMFITDELFNVRRSLLELALDEVKACEDLKQRILKIDEAFRKGLVKNSVDECEKRFKSDEILNFQDPTKKNAA